MKNLFLFKVVLTAGLASVFGSLCLAASAPEGLAPKSWFLSSEGLSIDSRERKSLEAPSAEFTRRVAEIFNAKGAAFDQMVLEDQYLASEDWELSLIKGELALNSTGVLGYLALAGTTAVQSHWYRKSAQGQKFFNEMTGQSFYRGEQEAVDFSANSSSSQIEEQIQRLGERIRKSGKVDSVQKVLAAVRTRLALLQRWSKDFPQTSAWSWVPVSLRVELIFDAHGKILPEATVGGDLRLTLQWLLPSPGVRSAQTIVIANEASVMAKEAGVLSKDASDFGGFVTGLSQDLTEAFGKEEPLSVPEGIDLAIGLGVGGQLGLATGKGLALAQLAFKLQKPRVDSASFRGFSKSSEPLLLLSGPSLMPLEPRIFRDGLRRAQAMGKFFLAIAKKKQFKHWQFRALRSSYTMGLDGALGLATLNGSVSVNYFYLESKV